MINEIFKFVLEGLGPQGQQLTNTMYYKQTTSAGDDSGTELIDGWYAAALAEYAAMVSDTCAFTKMHTRNLSRTQYGLDYALSPSVPGDLTGECLPPQCAAVIQFASGFIGKANRGRNYLWPTVETMQNAGQWSNPYLALVTTYGNAIATVTSAGASYVHCVLAGIDTDPDPAGNPVIEATADPIVRSQRRRVSGVGS